MRESREPGRPMLNRTGHTPPGPWWDEPDRVEWSASGLDCEAYRGPSAAWCGYVAVPPEHPLFGRDYSGPLLSGVEVHGGLTFAGPRRGSGDPAGFSADRWWFGFDCSHAGDLSPAYLGLPRFPSYPGEVYRTVGYVRDQVEALALQLAHWRHPQRERIADALRDAFAALIDGPAAWADELWWLEKADEVAAKLAGLDES